MTAARARKLQIFLNPSRAVVELVAVGVVAVYNSALDGKLSGRARFATNIGAAAALVGRARLPASTRRSWGSRGRVSAGRARRDPRGGADRRVGRGRGGDPANARVARRREDHRHRPGKAAFETVVRIPLETATAEEMIFRGVLLGVGAALGELCLVRLRAPRSGSGSGTCTRRSGRWRGGREAQQWATSHTVWAARRPPWS